MPKKCGQSERWWHYSVTSFSICLYQICEHLLEHVHLNINERGSLVYSTTVQWERAISHLLKISFKCLEAILKQIKRKQVNFNTFYLAQNIWTEIISVWNQYKITGFFLFCFFLLSFSHTRCLTNTWCEFSLKHISFQTDIWKSH